METPGKCCHCITLRLPTRRIDFLEHLWLRLRNSFICPRLNNMISCIEASESDGFVGTHVGGTGIHSSILEARLSAHRTRSLRSCRPFDQAVLRDETGA